MVLLLWIICVNYISGFVLLLGLFIAALCSPSGKGLTSCHSFVMFYCVLSLSHVVSYVRWFIDSLYLPPFLLCDGNRWFQRLIFLSLSYTHDRCLLEMVNIVWITFVIVPLSIHHECEGRIEKICPEDGRLASRGLPSDDKRRSRGTDFSILPSHK